MATYRQSCIHCGALIDRDAKFCPACRSMSPFGYHCPTCLRPIQTDEAVCPGCGRSLYTHCPACAKQTFVRERCSACGASLMLACQNPRCQALQFFENTKCNACGKKIKQQTR